MASKRRRRDLQPNLSTSPQPHPPTSQPQPHLRRHPQSFSPPDPEQPPRPDKSGSSSPRTAASGRMLPSSGGSRRRRRRWPRRYSRPPTLTISDLEKKPPTHLCYLPFQRTTRPTHYHILHDEIGFTPDDLQEFVHSLSYMYQRSTTAISVVAPICYARLAAAQVDQFIKFDELSETSSSQGGCTSAGSVPVQELPGLHKNVSSSMFFC